MSPRLLSGPTLFLGVISFWLFIITVFSGLLVFPLCLPLLRCSLALSIFDHAQVCRKFVMLCLSICKQRDGFYELPRNDLPQEMGVVKGMCVDYVALDRFVHNKSVCQS